MEASRLVFRWREGKLEARYDGMLAWEPSAVFEREIDDRWRTVSGPEQGEGLRIQRGPDGSVERMVWAGYPVTREPGPGRPRTRELAGAGLSQRAISRCQAPRHGRKGHLCRA